MNALKRSAAARSAAPIHPADAIHSTAAMKSADTIHPAVNHPTAAMKSADTIHPAVNHPTAAMNSVDTNHPAANHPAAPIHSAAANHPAAIHPDTAMNSSAAIPSAAAPTSLSTLFTAVLPLVAACVLAGCASDPATEGESLRLVTRDIRLEAAPPGTRTQLAPNGYDMLWSPGDTIGVFVMSGSSFTTTNAPFVYTGAEPAAGGTFSGSITLAEGASSYTLYAYYPYSSAATSASNIAFTLDTQQTQSASGDSSHLGDYDFLVAGALTSTTGDFSALSFSHAFAVIEVNLTGSGTMAGKRVESVMLFATDAATVSSSGTVSGMANMTGSFTFDLTGTTPTTATYAGGAAQIGYCGVAFTEPPVLGSESVTAYLTVNPADYSQGGGQVYAVVSTTDGYTATYTRSGPVITAAQMLVLTEDVATGTAAGPTVDLSPSGGETANCYVVSVPSQSYSFDATVAGNGVIPDGLQQAIQRYEGRTLSADLSGGGYAKLLWQSQPWLIEPGSVSYADGQITFALTERPTQLGGNAVIGLYADATSNEALWSWHIWVTDQTNEELQAAAETYTMYSTYETAYGTGSARMMDRNLGAIYNEAGPYARSFRASLFQWGRKDPFPWGDVVFDADSNPYNYLSEWTAVQTTGSPGQYVGYTGNTWYATAYPDTFIASVPGSSYDWYWGGGQGTTSEYRNNELWGNPDGTTVGSETTKTLFDPCPPGWKVPHPYVFSAFTQTGSTASVSSGTTEISGTFVQGWNFFYNGSSTTYYPGVGYRYDELGLFFFSQSGYYWTSSPAPSDSFGAWTFGLTSATVYECYSDPRGFGLPIRCQSE